jgi:hypothetical protein
MEVGGRNASIPWNLDRNLQKCRLFSNIVYINVDINDDIVYKYIDKKYGHVQIP